MTATLEEIGLDPVQALRLARKRFKDRIGRHPRSYTSLAELSADEAAHLVADGLRFKLNPAAAKDRLRGRSVVLLFQKNSTRTRSSFDAAARQMGGSSTYVEWRTSNFTRADLCDESRALSRFYDFIVARVDRHETIEVLKAESEVPVINGLCDLMHPCQALTDYLTLTEYFKDLRGLCLAYVGDNNNVCRSLAHGVGLFGIRMHIATPLEFRREEELTEIGRGSIQFFARPSEAVAGADVVYTDTWISMGDEADEQRRLNAFSSYQVNDELLEHAPPHCLVMHCLPALPGREISPTCLRSERSLVFDQAENRLHTQKALLSWLADINGM
jgi:ornithine carbamoyltransferase